MKKKFVFWVEEYFYSPNTLQKIVSFLLLPFSYLYCFVVWLKFKTQKEIDFGIKVVGVGNLTVGGSGKTPLVTALAQEYERCAVVLRGYGRASSGLFVVKDFKNILCDVAVSGDEAMIYAQKLSSALVIVSEDRVAGIQKAKEMGASVVFLDDAYSKHHIKKLDILIDVDSTNKRCLPSGPFRERLWSSKSVLILKDGVDFRREVALKDRCDKMSLLIAIARPKRLDAYLPSVVSKNYFEDHHIFTKDELEEVLSRDASDSLLVTYKDYVKVNSFGLPLSLLDMHIVVDAKILKEVGKYIES